MNRTIIQGLKVLSVLWFVMTLVNAAISTYQTIAILGAMPQRQPGDLGPAVFVQIIQGYALPTLLAGLLYVGCEIALNMPRRPADVDPT
jgi:hypothetical protein